MNWFARYGIPGSYFVLLIGSLYCITFGLPASKNITPEIVAIMAMFIPILGYILMIFTQRLYYVDCFPMKYCSKVWKKIDGEVKKEWEAEAKIAILARGGYDHNSIEQRKWLQEFITKRFDVISINTAIIISTIIGLILCFIFFLNHSVKNSILSISCNNNTFCWTYLIIWSIPSILIIAILCSANKLFLDQTREIAENHFEELYLLRKEFETKGKTKRDIS